MVFGGMVFIVTHDPARGPLRLLPASVASRGGAEPTSRGRCFPRCLHPHPSCRESEVHPSHALSGRGCGIAHRPWGPKEGAGTEVRAALEVHSGG